MAQGKPNHAIADSLSISEAGVEKHINAISATLGLDPHESNLNRRVAAVLAFLHDYNPATTDG